MARGNNPGKDFDDQFHQSKRRAQPKKDAGSSHWADDAAMRRAGQMRPSSTPEDKSCGKAALFLLGLLAGTSYALTEIAQQII